MRGSVPPNVTLFIVPWLAAGMRSGSARASAPKTTSVMRCDASTLPPATAAGRLAFTMRARRRRDGEGPRKPGVVEHVLANQTAQRVETRGPRDREVRVHAARGLAIGSREVDAPIAP